MVLKFKDNEELHVLGNSIVYDVKVELEEKSDVVKIWDMLTPEKISAFTLGGEKYEGYTFASLSVADNMVAHIYFSEPLTTREQELQARIDKLTIENEALQDGATAYEIITGGAE